MKILNYNVTIPYILTPSDIDRHILYPTPLSGGRTDQGLVLANNTNAVLLFSDEDMNLDDTNLDLVLSAKRIVNCRAVRSANSIVLQDFFYDRPYDFLVEGGQATYTFDGTYKTENKPDIIFFKNKIINSGDGPQYIYQPSGSQANAMINSLPNTLIPRSTLYASRSAFDTGISGWLCSGIARYTSRWESSIYLHNTCVYLEGERSVNCFYYTRQYARGSQNPTIRLLSLTAIKADGSRVIVAQNIDSNTTSDMLIKFAEVDAVAFEIVSRFLTFPAFSNAQTCVMFNFLAFGNTNLTEIQIPTRQIKDAILIMYTGIRHVNQGTTHNGLYMGISKVSELEKLANGIEGNVPGLPNVDSPRIRLTFGLSGNEALSVDSLDLNHFNIDQSSLTFNII